MCIFLDFEAHFKDVHKKHSPPDRTFFVHVTSVVVSAHFCFLEGGAFWVRAHRQITGYKGHHCDINHGRRWHSSSQFIEGSATLSNETSFSSILSLHTNRVFLSQPPLWLLSVSLHISMPLLDIYYLSCAFQLAQWPRVLQVLSITITHISRSSPMPSSTALDILYTRLSLPSFGPLVFYVSGNLMASMSVTLIVIQSLAE